MAKLFPTAELPPRPDDMPLDLEDMLQLSFLARLPRDRKEKLLKYPGAMKLRHVRPGEIVCEQGDEGCTAFVILRGTDLCRVRDLLRTRGDDGRQALQRVEANLAGLEVERRSLLEAANAADVELSRRQQELQQQLDALKKAKGPADQIKALDQEVQFLRTANAEDKRARAAQMEATDPNLARWLRDAARGEDNPPPFAKVQLQAPGAARGGKGFWAKLKGWWKGQPADPQDDVGPSFLPSDAPAELDFKTRQSSLLEGDLLGEMACLNRRPRSATVIAQRDGFLLEMLSHILEEVDKDPDYQKERERTYRRRVLDLHLRDLSLFRALSDTQYAQIVDHLRQKVELVTFTSGQVVCDEHDRSDSLYLVRDGLVQVIVGSSALLRPQDVADWAKLTAALTAAAGPGAGLAKLLPAPALAVFKQAGGPTEDKKPELVQALNDLIKSPKAIALPELKDTLEGPGFRQRGYYLPVDRKTWMESHHRRAARLLLELACPGALAPLAPPAAGGDRILTYLGRGEFFGEIGLMEKGPRTASCIAYGQPRLHAEQKELGRVELVKINQELFDDLLTRFPFLREKIAAVVAQRKQRTQKVLAQPAAPSPEEIAITPEASRLGLLQGQKLMLIDLEKCTRCDECVRACVDSHSDGRSRLFLTGPRYGKYLAPLTCRSCLDPVCLIGCPVRSIQRGDNLEIQIKNWCTGCGICARQCPYSSIQIHPLAHGEEALPPPPGAETVDIRGRAAVCDMCSTLASQDPACVYACPHDAAQRVDFRTVAGKM